MACVLKSSNAPLPTSIVRVALVAMVPDAAVKLTVTPLASVIFPTLTAPLELAPEKL